MSQNIYVAWRNGTGNVGLDGIRCRLPSSSTSLVKLCPLPNGIPNIFTCSNESMDNVRQKMLHEYGNICDNYHYNGRLVK